jgi:hypothetical protein
MPLKLHFKNSYSWILYSSLLSNFTRTASCCRSQDPWNYNLYELDLFNDAFSVSQAIYTESWLRSVNLKSVGVEGCGLFWGILQNFHGYGKEDLAYSFMTHWRRRLNRLHHSVVINGKISTYSEILKRDDLRQGWIYPYDQLRTTPWRRMGGWHIAPRIHNLSTRWKWVVRVTFRPLDRTGKVGVAFGRCLFRISAGILADLTEVFFKFRDSTLIRPRPLPSISSPVCPVFESPTGVWIPEVSWR